MNSSLQFLQTSKLQITHFIEAFLKEREKEFKSDVPWVHDSYKRLGKFVVNGKMIRGGLFLLSCEMFGEKITQRHYAMAAGIEFFHSCLLIHDDIMDNDYIRRGEQTIFAQYEQEAQKKGMSDPRQYGNSMATCMGDISLFLAYSLFGTSRVSLPTDMRLLAYFTKEAEHVGFGQMQDFHLSRQGKDPRDEEILAVYKYKTARYTFSLPLAMGAILTNQTDAIVETLEQIGEYAGMIFQFRDDELRYFSTEAKIGKTVGSDVRENTKTMYRSELLQAASPQERKKLLSIFGNHNATNEEIAYVGELIKKRGVYENIQKRLMDYRSRANTEIIKLPVAQKYRLLLVDLIEYMYVRDK